MRFESKIAITGILTYIVFGLYNLFGQPQQFIPPLYFDYLFLSVLSLIFLYRLKFNLDFMSILLIGLALTCGGLIETQISKSIVLGIICIIALPTSFLLNGISSILYFTTFRPLLRIMILLFISGIIIFILFQALDINNELNDRSPQYPFRTYLYWLTGIPAMLMSSLSLFYRQLSDGQVRFFTLVFLSAFFDFATYFSLNFLI